MNEYIEICKYKMLIIRQENELLAFGQQNINMLLLFKNIFKPMNLE